jgi:transcriptional regulator with XRE-family HTH domain
LEVFVKIYDYNGRKNICGERIHEARCKLRLTQSDLAAQLQLAGIIIERDSVSRIEIGTRFVADYELRELAKILKVSVNWLLGL